jgi:hypothetical protein
LNLEHHYCTLILFSYFRANKEVLEGKYPKLNSVAEFVLMLETRFSNSLIARAYLKWGGVYAAEAAVIINFT